jgi:hypothetical protein
MIKKVTAITFALLVMAVMALPQHGGTGPQPCGPGTPGGPGIGCGDAAEASVYDDATAVWNFNDPTDLGAEAKGTTAYDLTLVNTPTATGGALGYAMNLLDTSSQYATATAITAKSTDRSICAWWDQPSLLGDAFLGVGNVPIEFTPVWYLSVHVSNKIQLYQAGNATVGTVTISSDRNFICYTYDHSDTGAQVVYVNGVSDITKSFVDNAAHNATNFYVGVGFAGYWKGQIGPVVYYNAPIAQAEVTSMYNSGKGKTCADLSGDELTGLVSCWEMEEDGGPYADSIGSNTLTAVNTPTRAAGLVERSDSGMGTTRAPGVTSGRYTHPTVLDGFSGGDLTFFMWVIQTSAAQSWQSGGSAGGWDSSWEMLTAGGVWQTAFYNDDPADLERDYVPHQTTWTNHQWHLIGFTYDHATKTSTIYYDGVAGTTTSVLSDGLNLDAAPDFSLMGLGIIWDGVIGAVDNVAMWPRVLTSEEIDGLFDAGAGDFYSAYWDVFFSGDPIRFAWSAMPEIRRTD